MKRHSAYFILYCGVQAVAVRHMHQYCGHQSERGEGEAAMSLTKPNTFAQNVL